MQRGKGIGSLFRGLFRFVNPLLYSVTRAVGKDVLKTGSNIITDILHKEPEQPVGDIFKNCFCEENVNFEEKINKMTGYDLDLKRNIKYKKAQS